MAPNNALGKATATKLRRAAEGASPPPARPSRSPARQRKAAKSSPRVATADGFGAGDYITGVLNRSEVAGRGTGSRATPKRSWSTLRKSALPWMATRSTTSPFSMRLK